tara:strand:+ start:918 stop:1370 length:453 start_codon:yes stop_codon:yes gene_type:complete
MCVGFRKRGLILALGIALAGCGQNDPGLAKTMGITDSQRSAIEARICSYDGNDCFLPIMVNIEGGNVQVAQVEELPGKALYAGCIACHGAQGSGGIGPTLAGKSHEYIMGRLMAYKAGEKIGPQSNMMWSQASMLSEKEIHQVTEYIETL